MLSNQKINLLNYDKIGLIEYFTQLGEKPFRATQILKWIHQLGITDFAVMTNLSLALRNHLAEHACIKFPTMVSEQLSSDGTRKWLLQLDDGNFIETVFIPEKNRGTLCISTQVGCPIDCAFCATGKLGFKRNLTTAEIIGQVWLAKHNMLAESDGAAITNVVIMGMGEPLLNFENVVSAINLMFEDIAYGLSKYRITLSTAGLVPEIRRLSKLTDIALAISLHAPTDELRNTLVPINKKYPLAELIKACKEFYSDPRRKVTFEYIMLDQVNESTQQAKQLVKLLSNINCKINLIPCNFAVNSKFRSSARDRVEAFRNVLLAAGFNTITRKTRGADIAAACGQLAGKQDDNQNNA